MYLVNYTCENEFRKLERSVKKYNMIGYKKLLFEIYPNIKDGNFLGDIEKKDKNYIYYAVKLPTDPNFGRLHGDFKLHYKVCKTDQIIELITIEPEDILLEGHHTELETYKGIMISKNNRDKDMFKIDLLNMLNKK